MVEKGMSQLERQGHPNVRPAHEFALRAIRSGADNAGDLAKRLSVSKQAAAKTITALEGRGYITRSQDPEDSRRKQIVLTSHGNEMLAVGQRIFDAIRQEWEQQLGGQALANMEANLRELVGDRFAGFDTAGWFSNHD